MLNGAHCKSNGQSSGGDITRPEVDIGPRLCDDPAALAEGPYRFLLRMPQELRSKLTHAAERGGNSLNREIVRRLEQSLDEEAAVSAAADAERGDMHRGVSRVPLRVLVGAAVIVAAALAVVLAVGSAAPDAQAPQQQAAKPTREAVAGNRGEPDASAAEEDPTAAAAEAYEARAYPAAEVSFTATLDAQKAWKALKGKGGKGKNQAGQWTLAGPSTADYPSVLTFSGADYTASGRVTALAIDPSCSKSSCRVWVGAAGGGVWRTENALSGNGANWTFVSESFATNAIGSLTYANGVLYAGTGEPNASGDSEAGMGLYKSTDGGDTWTLLPAVVGPISTSSPGTAGAFPNNGTYTGNAFVGRSISALVVDPTNPNHLYVGSTRGVRGISSVTGGTTSNPPTPRPPFGLFESNDGGATFSFIWDGSTGPMNGTTALSSVRGTNDVELDPDYNGTTNRTVYAATFASGAAGSGGVWRSTDGGATWAQIKSALNPTLNTDRAEFAVTKLANGNTRRYVGVGNQVDATTNRARLYRTDDARAASPTFTDLTTDQNIGYCTAQCWYDNVVYSPPGKPDVVYLGGSYSYGTYGFSTNGRAFIRSANAGVSFTDMTWDAGTDLKPAGNCCQPNAIAPNGQHPDSHAIVEIPGTDSAIFGTDGGLMRSDGSFTDISWQCASRSLSGANLATCQQLLSSVPSTLYTLNKGLSTLQFQSLSVAPDNPKHLQGGTQDNGTLETTGSAVVWPQIIYGDGGQSGFSSGNSALRFNSYFGQNHDANFQDGDPTKWVIISGPIVTSPEGSLFYAPIIADPNPANAGTIFEGSQSVWRTQDWGGNQAFLEANCPEFTTPSATATCGDFVRIGPSGTTQLSPGPPPVIVFNTDLTAPVADYRGTTRAGGNVAAVERAASDTGTLWAATTTGRVFISKNADTAASSVTFTRLDTLASATADPQRFVSGIFVDPGNANHAWISYSGYNFNTPAQPGHVFSVTYNQATGDATWTSLDGTGATSFPDFPATDVVRDSNGDLYASTDFGVIRLPSGASGWEVGGEGLPQVEVAGLTIVPAARKLYAATHGRSAWQLTLP
jgi:hypothetical protein